MCNKWFHSVGNPYKVNNEAVRQMTNSYTSGPLLPGATPVYQPVSGLAPQSSHVYSRPYKASYLNRIHKSTR